MLRFKNVSKKKYNYVIKVCIVIKGGKWDVIKGIREKVSLELSFVS